MNSNLNNFDPVIFVGGRSRRMSSLSSKKHKCLLKIGNFTILSHIYTQLRLLGFKKIYLCTGYKSQKINQFVKKKIKLESDSLLKILNRRKTSSIKIFLSKSRIDSSTSEKINLIKKNFKLKNLLILYGDTLLKLDKSRLSKFIDLKKSFDIILTASNPPVKFGTIENKKDKLIFFHEKKINKNLWVNSGWIFLRENALKFINNKTENFEEYLFNIKKIKYKYVFKNTNFYFPIDTINDLIEANNFWRNNKKTWF